MPNDLMPSIPLLQVPNKGRRGGGSGRQEEAEQDPLGEGLRAGRNEGRVCGVPRNGHPGESMNRPNQGILVYE